MSTATVVSTQSTFEAMAAFLASAKELLVSYRDDFFVSDRRILKNTWFPGVRYLWYVREAGTSLALLGIHPKLTDQAQAIVEACEGTKHAIFLVEGGRLKAVTRERALSLIGECKASYDDNRVVYKGREIALYYVTDEYVEAEHRSHYAVHFDSNGAHLSVEDLVVLQGLADVIVREQARSLFYVSPLIYLDHQDFYQALDRIRGL